MAGGTNHHLRRHPPRPVRACVNLSNFLLDLVEAIKTELAPKRWLQSFLKEMFQQAGRWLAGWTLWASSPERTDSSKGLLPSLRDEHSSSENASWAGYAWRLVSVCALALLSLQTSPPPVPLSVHMLDDVIAYCAWWSITVRKRNALSNPTTPDTS